MPKHGSYRKRARGRGRKTWKDCVTDDVRRLKPRQEDAQDRAIWKSGISENRPTRASAEMQTLNQ